MKSTIIAKTVELPDGKEVLMNEDIESFEIFCGKCAAVCYMKEPYFNSYVSDSEKALKRFVKVSGTGHHSPADHVFITVLFEDIPKMLAMILDSVGFYNASEKSGRYTYMESFYDGDPKYKRNYELYYKWKNIFVDKIKEYDPSLGDSHIEKLALENARYMLSVFAPSTTMAYTASLRMWSYMYHWSEQYLKDHAEDGTDSRSATRFNKELYKCFESLHQHIEEAHLYSDSIKDNKPRTFRFLAEQSGLGDIKNELESIRFSYLTHFETSFACLAHLIRHRTLDFYMCYSGSELDERRYYIPKLLHGTELVNEWLNDLNSIETTFPNATIVDVTESGNILNFMDMADERLCGRVLLETMDVVVGHINKFARCGYGQTFDNVMKRHISDGTIKMKCSSIPCKEPCHWGAKYALERLV